MNSTRRARKARLCRRRTETPYVEVGSAFFEGRGRKKRIDKLTRVFLELRSLSRGIAVSQNQEVDLGCRIPGLLDLEERTGRRGLRFIDEHISRVDDRRPHFTKRILRIAFLQHDLDRALRRRKPDRFVKGSIRRSRFVGGLPFAIDRGETAR